MSNEHAPTGGEGVRTDGGLPVSSEQAIAGEELDALFEVLAHDQRRLVLAHLDDGDEDVAAFSDLVERVTDEQVEDSDDCRERVAVQLHHAHLPKMAEAGLVEYDTRSETVRYRGGPGVSEWLTLARSYESNGS